MSLIVSSYEKERERMKPGDVIAFGGKSTFSEVIKIATWSHISHVSTILQTKVAINDGTNRYFNQVIESTSLNNFNGVSISRLSERIDNYDGDIWWLPLRRDLRENAEAHIKFYDFLFDKALRRVEYDMPQAIKSALDLLDSIKGPAYNREDFSKFFCSELIAAGFEAAGIVSTVNASEVTPIDLCRWNIYEDSYYLLKKGNRKIKKISRYNKLDPALWA